MTKMFKSISPTLHEIQAILPGDDIVPDADVVMDRAMTLTGNPDTLWPWFMQLGKNRAGWYFPRKIEWFIIRKKRATRHIDPQFQNLQVGKIIDDWGGRNATFEVAMIEKAHFIVYKSQRGATFLSWAIVFKEESQSTRVHFRLRLAPVKAKWLAHSVGNLFDALTIAGLRAGLEERVSKRR